MNYLVQAAAQSDQMGWPDALALSVLWLAIAAIFIVMIWKG